MGNPLLSAFAQLLEIRCPYAKLLLLSLVFELVRRCYSLWVETSILGPDEDGTAEQDEVLKLARSFEGTLERHLDDLVRIQVMDEAGHLAYINTAGARKLGYEPEELFGQPVSRIDPTATRPPVNVEAFSTAEHKKVHISHDGRDLCKDGSIIRSRYNARSITHQGKPYLLVATHDISDLFDALDEVNRERQICKEVMDSTSDAVIMCSASGTVLFANPAATDLLNNKPLETGQPVSELFALIDTKTGQRLAHPQLRSSDGGWEGTLLLTPVSGAQVMVRETLTQTYDMLGQVSGFLLRYRPVALEDRQNAYFRRELENEKYALIGRMASGISHDFNNILAGISGMAELVELRSERADIARIAADIQSLTMRAAEHVKSILATQAGDPNLTERKVFSLHETLDEVAQIIRFGHGAECAVECDYADDDPKIYGIQGAVLNAVLNIAVNAVQAMAGGGRLTIRTTERTLDKAFCSRSAFRLKPGSYVSIELTDTGSGIAREHLSEIFSPYFSTKRDAGGGHGLGLPAVMVTVRQHGGLVEVESEVGIGTTFRLSFPLATIRNYRDDAQREGETRSLDTPIRVSKRILVVEDEREIREVARQYLGELGHEAVLAADGIEALAKFRTTGSRFDAVILDLMLPGVTGTEVLSAIRTANPTLPVIISSGWAPETMSMELQGYGALTFLRKPYRLQEIADSLARLDRENG